MGVQMPIVVLMALSTFICTGIDLPRIDAPVLLLHIGIEIELLYSRG